jgi:hypothetical protein
MSHQGNEYLELTRLKGEPSDRHEKADFTEGLLRRPNPARSDSIKIDLAQNLQQNKAGRRSSDHANAADDRQSILK